VAFIFFPLPEKESFESGVGRHVPGSRNIYSRIPISR